MGLDVGLPLGLSLPSEVRQFGDVEDVFESNYVA